MKTRVRPAQCTKIIHLKMIWKWQLSLSTIAFSLTWLCPFHPSMKPMSQNCYHQGLKWQPWEPRIKKLRTSCIYTAQFKAMRRLSISQLVATEIANISHQPPTLGAVKKEMAITAGCRVRWKTDLTRVAKSLIVDALVAGNPTLLESMVAQTQQIWAAA